MRTNYPTVRTRSTHLALELNDHAPSREVRLEALDCSPRDSSQSPAATAKFVGGPTRGRLSAALLALVLVVTAGACTAADSNVPDPESVPIGDEAGTSEDGEAIGAAACTDQLAAIVNGQEIPLADFQTQAFDTQRYFVEQGLDPNTDAGQQQLSALRRQVLDDMISQALIEQYAIEQSIDVSDGDLDTRMQVYVDEAGGEEAFEASLSEAGSSRESLRQMERKAMIGQQVLDLIAGDVPANAEHRHARHILCETEDACRDALQRLQSGETFADVAESVSKDVTTAGNGGDLEWLARGMVPSPELEEIVFTLPVGQVSDVVKTDFGFHIVEVLEVDETRELAEQQRYALREKALLDWIAERRATSDIVTCIPEAESPGE